MSLRRKFALILAVFSGLLAAAFGFLAWEVSSEALRDELDRRLLQVAGAVAGSGAFIGSTAIDFEPGLEDVRAWPIYRERLIGLRRYVSDAFIFDASNRPYRALVTASPSDSIPIGTPLRVLEAYQGEINRALRGSPSTTNVFTGEDGRLYKWGFVRLDDTPAILGVRIPADFFAPLARLGSILLWGSLAGMAVAVALGVVLARNITEPLERLSRVALRIQRGHLHRSVEVERGDELGRLSRAMERMRVGILERDEQLRLMLAQVAHEIRNPLGGLELFASAAADTEDPAERQRLMARVRGEVQDLNRIINDFLAYARPLQGEREASDLREPVRAAVELATAEMERAGSSVELELPEERLLAVVDPDQVKRAVLNLVRNGAQAGTRVRVEARREGSGVLLSVADDGPGVPEEQRKRIFEPFITDKEKGAGLGLAIVRKVAEAHGGWVEVGDATDPSFGNGAEFRVYFVGLEEPPAAALDAVTGDGEPGLLS